MNYINTQTNEYPISLSEINDTLPNVTFAPSNPPAPFAPVNESEQPAFDSLTQDCTESAPEIVGGQWRQTWTVTDVSPEVAAQRAAAAFEMSVPGEVTKRQAKTLMELTPNAAHGNLWLAAIAAAEAIPDPAQRIVTRNYIVDSQVYERARVHGLCALLGMTSEQADQMMIAADKL